MIHDSLANSALYAGLGPRFAAAFRFLADPATASLPDGRLALDGDALYANIQSYETRPPLPVRLETHRRYADVQFISSGEERIGIASAAGLAVLEPYRADADIAFWNGASPAQATLRAGEFMVLFPHEAHQPCCHPSGAGVPCAVRKIVVKVLLGD